MSFFLQLMSDHFADEITIGLADGEGTAPTVVRKEFGRVGEVKIPRKEERMRKFAGLVQERMAECRIVSSEGSIAEMPEKDLPLTRNRVLTFCDCPEHIRKGGR